MSRTEPAVFTNMCMITQESRVLVQDRKDPDWPGVTFPGGHVEPGESFAESVVREVWEETDLTIENPRLCGVKQFPLNGGGRYVVLFYRADTFTGTIASSEEGEVFGLRERNCFPIRLQRRWRICCAYSRKMSCPNFTIIKRADAGSTGFYRGE